MDVRYRVTITIGRETVDVPFATKVGAKDALVGIMRNWRRRGEVRCPGTALRTPRFAKNWTATWNDDYTTATLKYGSSQYVAGIVRLVTL